jgi:hypothetical protein
MTGDQNDFAQRLRSLLPTGWFPAGPALGETETAPVLMGLLNGLGNAWAQIWSLLTYANLQNRLATATGAFVDAFAQDYFGASILPRRTGENDLSYRGRIKAALLPSRGTRASVIGAVIAETGIAPIVVEPRNPLDTKAYGSMANPVVGGGYGYGASGLRYGSMIEPYQMFLTVQNSTPPVPHASIYAAIDQNLAAGTVAWTAING